jgi:hypothetical protein
VLAPVLLKPIEPELEKLDPLDLLLLPLLELLEPEPLSEMRGPVLPPQFEMPGLALEPAGPASDCELD